MHRPRRARRRAKMSQIPYSEVRSWMFELALPFWAEAGLDRAHGGFLEELRLDGSPADIAFKRVRVTCRQIYVFSHAALLGWRAGAALSTLGYDYLVDKAWLGEGQGWARRLTRQGDVLDTAPDLYDIAFVLFALAWRYKLTGEAETLGRMHATLAFVRTQLRAAPHEGFWHALPPLGPRLQNPHMHLLEACLAAFEACGDERYLDGASETVGLFQRYFFDGRTLAEYFTADWGRALSEEGRSVEPGHQFEWAWLLAQYQRTSGVSTDLAGSAAALIAFGERFGVDAETQATYDEVRDDGAPLRTTSRAWPNTERIKGHLGLYELTGADPRQAAAAATRVLLDRYLALPLPGAWIDQFDALLQPMSQTIPASTLYHVFLAFAELLRLQPRLEREA